MRIQYILPMLAMAFTVHSQAQNSPVILTDANGTVVNGTTLHITEALNGDLGQIMAQALTSTNSSGSQRTVNVKRYEMDVLPNTQNYFCWSMCYDAVTAGDREFWVSPHPKLLGGGEVFSGFYGDYMPMNILGASTFRFVWYDVDNTSDSTWVDLVYTASEQVGIAEVAAVRGFTAFPNPSVAGNVTFNYDLATASVGTQLVVYNMLGERKMVKAIGAAQGTVVLNDGDLSSGVWFAVLERNGKPLATKRVVVLR